MYEIVYALSMTVGENYRKTSYTKNKVNNKLTK